LTSGGNLCLVSVFASISVAISTRKYLSMQGEYIKREINGSYR